ncbi:hypothetical protein IT402_03110, partial [Candidatus Nomurabacteria bacterium]|nr:hypothetical protein [Candidatus Nomurabacteria bacterium]
SYLYAGIVGIGIVLFWRGVWHSVDTIHMYISHYGNTLTISANSHPWWDGPISFIVGCIVLYLTRAFVSSFVGNELILSGLRIEKKLAKETKEDLESEVSTISDIKHTLSSISRKMEDLETQIKDHHKK